MKPGTVHKDFDGIVFPTNRPVFPPSRGQRGSAGAVAHQHAVRQLHTELAAPPLHRCPGRVAATAPFSAGEPAERCPHARWMSDIPFH